MIDKGSTAKITKLHQKTKLITDTVPIQSKDENFS